MKLLTFAVPCYNSQDYIGRCIESLLPGGDEVEILIIDDGSTDLTGDMADKYQEKYPGIIRAIHQENGGHGEAVNTGIRNATGLYFKVVDSDDRIDPDAYRQVLDKLRELTGGDVTLDMMLCNFVYDKDGAKRKKVMHYESSVPVEELVSWDDTKHFRKGKYILMHSVIYRTKLLRSSGIELPKHTFFEDNLYVYAPLRLTKTLCYLDENLYQYLIGREGQSVSEASMKKNYKHQIVVA
ncbi:MAG: glycosyltransferase family 2 protein, partial [Lachnospiraceae bacterium]|nr:glycosyltransferase family 2 protein [Lachnospiraceae bacterium]